MLPPRSQRAGLLNGHVINEKDPSRQDFALECGGESILGEKLACYLGHGDGTAPHKDRTDHPHSAKSQNNRSKCCPKFFPDRPVHHTCLIGTGRKVLTKVRAASIVLC